MMREEDGADVILRTRENPVGRPAIAFDSDVIEGLATIQCTDEEIAAVLGCSVDTLARRKVDDPEFANALARGKARGRQTLRRSQWQAATGPNPNPAMMIWLGKQLLGQRDQIDQNLSGEIGLYRLTEDELRVRAHALLAKASGDE